MAATSRGAPLDVDDQPNEVKCTICLDSKDRANFATCDRCAEGAVCYDCASRCDCFFIGSAAENLDPQGPPASQTLVMMVCPVCEDTIVFDAAAPGVTKTMALRIFCCSERYEVTE